MSTQQKVQLARSAVPEHGIRPVLSALELPRSTWYYHRQPRPSYAEKYAHLREPMEKIATELSEYGYRRTKTELAETYGEHPNHKVVQRLHGLWDLPLLRGTKAPKPSGIRQVITEAGDRANLVARLEEIGLFEVFYTDFTEIHYGAPGQKAFLIPLLGHESKLVAGWALGERAITTLALEAWDRASATLAEFSLTPTGRIIHHDQDPVFTSYAWTHRLLIKDHCRVSYALEGAKDNPFMESFFGRFKTENRSLLQDAETLEELRPIVAARIDHYNGRRRHSSIGNQAPLTYVRSLLMEGHASQH